MSKKIISFLMTLVLVILWVPMVCPAAKESYATKAPRVIASKLWTVNTDYVPYISDKCPDSIWLGGRTDPWNSLSIGDLMYKSEQQKERLWTGAKPVKLMVGETFKMTIKASDFYSYFSPYIYNFYSNQLLIMSHKNSDTVNWEVGGYSTSVDNNKYNFDNQKQITVTVNAIKPGKARLIFSLAAYTYRAGWFSARFIEDLYLCLPITVEDEPLDVNLTLNEPGGNELRDIFVDYVVGKAEGKIPYWDEIALAKNLQTYVINRISNLFRNTVRPVPKLRVLTVTVRNPNDKPVNGFTLQIDLDNNLYFTDIGYGGTRSRTYKSNETIPAGKSTKCVFSVQPRRFSENVKTDEKGYGIYSEAYYEAEVKAYSYYISETTAEPVTSVEKKYKTSIDSELVKFHPAVITTVRCPVDAKILDNKGNLLATIKNGSTDITELDGLVALAVEDAKYIIMSNEKLSEYRIELEATDNGTMRLSTIGLNEDIDPANLTVFKEVPLVKGEIFDTELVDDNVMRLFVSEGGKRISEIKPDEVVSGDELAELVDANENSTSEQGNVTAGMEIRLQIGNPYMWVNGVQQEVDPGRGTTPIIQDSRTMLPIRAVVEALGGEVSWEGETKKIVISVADTTIIMQIGSKSITVNGTEKQMDIAPEVINDRTMLPIHFVADNLPGCKLEWIDSTKTIVLSFNSPEDTNKNVPPTVTPPVTMPTPTPTPVPVIPMGEEPDDWDELEEESDDWAEVGEESDDWAEVGEEPDDWAEVGEEPDDWAEVGE